MNNENYQEITICMGSSCFSRGNNRMIGIIKEFLKSENLENSIILSGALCEGRCKNGPGITINGKHFDRLTPDSLQDILYENLIKQKA
jgi:NADH:ubiquinone oxidoreductase subunit E